MAVDAALAMSVGAPIAKKVWETLSKKKDGTQRLVAVSTAFTKGMSAIEAFISVFGGEFLKALTDALGGGNGAFSYEGGIAGYIKLEGPEGSSPFNKLRDELNINLDRIAIIEGDKAAVKNQFRGALHIWQGESPRLL